MTVERLSRFEHFQYLGDKRTQIVHDIDATDETDTIADLVAAEAFLAFAPDTLAEARNRGYRPCRHCAATQGA